MIRLRSLASLGAFAIALPMALSVPGTPASAQKPVLPADPPKVSLFDGTTLNGWRAYKKTDAAGSRWAAKNGELTLVVGSGATGAARDIISAETYDTFDLTWEWKIAPEIGRAHV